MNHGTRGGAVGTEYRGGKRIIVGNALTSDIAAPIDVVRKMRYRDKWEQTSDSPWPDRPDPLLDLLDLSSTGQ